MGHGVVSCSPIVCEGVDQLQLTQLLHFLCAIAAAPEVIRDPYTTNHEAATGLLEQ